ncbi:MAG TPA: hypothetical protein VFE25_14600 [Opitutaceae bacterium]|jgi:hypothetical protein|nr:hypothetical protein [Opitutaceae bacterium]
MKSLVTLIAVCIVGYWLYTFYSQNPDELPSMVHRSKDVVSTPIPQENVDAPQVPPKLDVIQVARGPVLTHAKVKSARPNSIVFLCDQGLFEVNYDRLPPEFETFYRTQAVATSVPSSESASSAPAPVPAQAPAPKIAPQRSYEDDMNARLNLASRKAALEGRQQGDLDTMTRWYKQSNFEPGGLTQQDFDTAKADYDAATAQLNTLVAQGVL